MHEGYHWDQKEYIFTEFVDTLYSLRMSFNKQDPKNLICKLLLNSLYGRFGLSPRLEEYSFSAEREIESKVADNLLVNKLEVGDLFGYKLNKNQDLSGVTGRGVRILTTFLLVLLKEDKIYLKKGLMVL